MTGPYINKTNVFPCYYISYKATIELFVWLAGCLTHMFDEVPPGPVPLAVLDAPLRDDVVLVVEVPHGQGARGHEGDPTEHHLGSHLRFKLLLLQGTMI